MNKVLKFVTEVRNELTKVSWPGRDELVGAVIIVCIVVVIFAAILGSMDFSFSYFIRKFII